jgi:16S rRNA (adenine1518-N6/adenine1519-N6)-dimethyltransferase
MPQKLGQHFLNDHETLAKIAAAIEARAGETIIEIGPGHGELTHELFVRYPDSKIVVIEKDTELAAYLKEHLGTGADTKKNDTDIEIITGDARKELTTLAARLAKEKKLFRVIGNIPYYLTGNILRVIGELETLPKSVVLLMQKEVAERIAAQPPDMNRLAASVQYWATSEILGVVGRDSFTPPPDVESASIRLTTKTAKAKKESTQNVDSEIYYETVRAVFQQPRKTLFNNLFSALKAKYTAMTSEKIREMIQQLLDEEVIDPTLRPQDLGVEEIAKLSPLFLEENSV